MGSVLDSLIRETFESNQNKNHDIQLAEKDKQVKLSSKNDSQSSEKTQEKSEDNREEENDDTKAMQTVPDLEQIIEKLNSIRSGHSLRDSAVKDRFEGYVNDLQDTEKVALFAFLKGISQIITGDLEPELATEPEDDPAHVKMHRGKKVQKVQKKSVDANVIKKPDASSAKKSSSSSEDTTPPTPVNVKR